MVERAIMTKEGLEKLKEELNCLKGVERTKVVREIEKARAHGDLSENAEYDAAKDRQGILEAKIEEIEDRLARAEVVDTSGLKGDKVVFGARVEIKDLAKDQLVSYKIVGEGEGNVSNGLLSINSPLAKALIGSEVGDLIDLETPSGLKEYEVLKIYFE